MRVLISILYLFVFLQLTLSIEDNNIASCNKEDKECFYNLSKQFLRNLVKGVPELIDSLDPLVMKSFDFETMEEINFHYTDLKITGMSNAELLETSLNTKEMRTEIKMKLDLNIEANMAIEFTDIKKSVHGMKYKAKTNPADVVAIYSFIVSSNDEGVKYFDIKNETTTCKLTKDPIVNLDADLDKQLREDQELQQKIISFNKNDSKVWKDEMVCNITKAVVSKLIDNLRTVCKVTPATELIKDI